LPWKVLGELAYQPAPPRNGDQWRVNFSRVEWRHELADGKYRRVPGTKEDNWVWSPQGVIDMHRPETWGYVQFSTARPGTDRLRPDPAAPARSLLHTIYYAQRTYANKHGRWARTLSELGLAQIWHETLTVAPRLEITESGFEATVEIQESRRKHRRWHIRQDSRVWSD